MSTQSLLTIDRDSIQNKIDQSVYNSSVDFLKGSVLGIERKLNNKSMFIMGYLSSLYDNNLNCNNLLQDESNLIKINKIINKYG